MKNESSEIQAAQSLPLIKLLGIFTAAFGVLYHGWLNMVGGVWLAWLVLVLLILLEAGAAESRAAAWSHASAVLLRILGPAILPFYGALCLLLAVGPSYMRQAPTFALPTKGSSLAETPGIRSASKPGALNVMPVPSTTPRQFSSLGAPNRPNIPPPTTTLGTTPRPNASPPSGKIEPAPQTASSVVPAVSPAASKPVSRTPAGVSRSVPIEPTSSARPAPAAVK